jgi:hypothetical protein
VVGRGEPKHKGIGLIPVVKGLKANPLARARVPAALSHYFESSVIVSAWYPERDYNALISVLAASVDAKQVGGNVWAFFGRVAAHRDIAGDQAAVPARSRTDAAGLYRNFRDVDANDVAGLLLRVTKVWSLYHDTGRALHLRHGQRVDTAIVRIVDFHFALRGLAELQTAYIIEYARLSGIVLEGSLARYASDLNSGCEWHFRVGSEPEKLRSVASLPLAD